VVGAGLETETEMMYGEGRVDDRLLRDDGRTHTAHNICYALAVSYRFIFLPMNDLARVYAELHSRWNLSKENPCMRV